MDVFRLLGWKVRLLRLENGFTQEELAFRVGAIDQAYVSEIEHGKVNLTLQMIIDISAALDVPVQELFSFTGAPDKFVKSRARPKSMNVLK